MLLAKNPRRNKRLFLVIGIVTIANLSVMATFPKFHLSTTKKAHLTTHFDQAQQLIKQSLLPLISSKYQQQCSYHLQKTVESASTCFFSGTLTFKKHKSTSSTQLPFKVFPKSHRIFIRDSRTRKFIDLKSWLKRK